MEVNIAGQSYKTTDSASHKYSFSLIHEHRNTTTPYPSVMRLLHQHYILLEGPGSYSIGRVVRINRAVVGHWCNHQQFSDESFQSEDQG